MQGVFTENTSNIGGSKNVGYIDTGDWMSYPVPKMLSTGLYRVDYRVARGLSGSGSLQFEKSRWHTRVCLATGTWQNWVTVAHLVNLSSGPIAFGIKATCGGCNFYWFHITRA
jgi:endoglucanase